MGTAYTAIVGASLYPIPLALSLQVVSSLSMPPFLIITGPGRSGTSAVAQVLHESGLRMGTEFLPPSEHNARGYFEDVAAREVNGRIMAAAGLGDLRTAPALPSREALLAAAEPFVAEQRRVASAGAQGWKDPQFCFTLESWLRALDARPRVVVCLRSPESYLQSVLAIVGLIERETAEAWWERHLRRLLEVIEAYRLEAHCVEYDELAADPEAVVAELGRFVGRPLEAGSVEPSLRSHAHPVSERQRGLYEEVRSLGRLEARGSKLEG